MLGLSLVVALAVAHALAHALIRPLYQVSDEVVYLTTVQAAALQHSPDRAACIAPPDGRVAPMEIGTKPGFRSATSLELTMLCGTTGGGLLSLRAMQALSAGVVAGCAWAIALTLTGHAAEALLAGLLVAAHPVAATHAGGVTPDAWANAFSALAFLAATRLVSDRGRWFDVALLLGATLAAFAWKDTAGFLLGLPVVVGVATATGAGPGRQGLWRVALAAALAVPVAVVSHFWFTTPYLRMAELYGPRQPWVDAVRVAIDDVVRQAPSLLGSSLTALGNFGASTLALPRVATLVGMMLAVASIVGVLRLTTQRQVFPRAVSVTWGLAAALCLLQPSARLAMLGTQDIHQGRWLLPLLAPVMVVMATGLLSWGRRGMVLWSLGALFVAWSGLVETVGFFWQALPTEPMLTSLYIRGTGGRVIDDALLLSAIEHTVRTLPAWVPGASLLLFAVLSAASLWSAAHSPGPDTRLP